MKTTTPEEFAISILRKRGHILGAGAKRVYGNVVTMPDPATSEEALAIGKTKAELKRQGYRYIPRKGFWFRADQVIARKSSNRR